MPEPLQYLKASGVAAIVSAMVVLAIVAVMRPASTTRLNVACPLGIGLGLAVGYYILSLRLSWPPANGLDRFLAIVVPATVCIELVNAGQASGLPYSFPFSFTGWKPAPRELIAGFQSVPRCVAWFLRMCLAVAIPRILLHDSTYLSDSGGDWTEQQAYTALVLSGALLAGLWILLSWLSQRSPGISIPLAVCLAIQCTGLIVMMAGYIKGGAASFPLAASLAATTIVAGFISKRSNAPADIGYSAILGIGVVSLFGLLFIGRFFGRLSTGCALAILLTPLLCWVSEVSLLRHRQPWLVASFRLALVVIPLAVVLAVAKRDFDRSMAPLLGSAKTAILVH